MSGFLRVVTPPTLEPVSLQEALDQCHADAGTEDVWFLATIKEARAAAEDFQSRAYLTQTLELVYHALPALPIILPRVPVASLVSVTVNGPDGSSTVLDNEDFFITSTEPAVFSFADGTGWPSIRARALEALQIRFVAGHETAAQVPEVVKAAIKLYIGWRYENRAGESALPDAFYSLLRSTRAFTYA